MGTRTLMTLLLMTAGSITLYGVWSLALIAGRPGDVNRLATRLDIRPGSTVADIGAGSGRWALPMATRIGPAGRLFATEVDEQQISALRARIARARLGNITVLRAAARDTSLPEACCDAVYMRAVAHHLEGGAALFEDVRRALTPGGRLAVIDFAPDGPWRWHFLFHRGAHGIIPAQVRALGEAAGLTCDEQVAGWSGGFHLTVFRRRE